MEHFLINSSACLFVLWLFYKLALENTSWHNWKRFYLLGSVIISLIIPFIVVETIVVPIQENTFNYIPLENAEYASEKQGFEIQWYAVMMVIYIIGVVIMLWRFGKNLSTFKIKNEDETNKYKIYQLVLRAGITVPHSFLNRIFVSAKDYKNDLIPNVVLEHEKAHLDQKHSLDILLIELLIVLFWFNPIFYILRYSIKLNHEFLADESVIQQGIPTTHYQELILQHATNNYQQSVANTFHFPIIKKRFSIMKTKTSKTNGLIRSLAIIPLITILILSCGEEEIKFENGNQQDSTEKQVLKPIEEFDNKIILKNKPIGRVTINEEEYSYKKEQGEYQFYNDEGDLFDHKNKGYEVIIITEVLEEVTSENITEYNSLARKHKAYMDKNNAFIVWNDETTRMQLIYNSMNEEQRANNEPWPYIGKHNGIEYEGGQIPPPPPPVSATDNQVGKIPPPPPPVAVEEIDPEFKNWRKANNRNLNVALPVDYIEYYGSKIDYYIDEEEVSHEKAKSLTVKEGCISYDIKKVNGVISMRMFTIK